MKKLIAIFILALSLLSTKAKAQTNVLLGISGGATYSNVLLGPSVAVEIPFHKKYELDLQDSFSPYEFHTALGNGWTNQATGTFNYKLTQRYGLNASFEDSRYSVTKVAKAGEYIHAGFDYRDVLAGSPAHFYFDYVRQIRNGIAPNGTETSQLQGGEVGFTMRWGCYSNYCIRFEEDNMFGGVKTQGNPLCDGTFYGPVTCPRTRTLSGGFTAGIYFEFPRRKETEDNIF